MTIKEAVCDRQNVNDKWSSLGSATPHGSFDRQTRRSTLRM